MAIIPEALTKIYAVALKHKAKMSSALTQDGAAIFGEAPGPYPLLDGYGVVNESRKFAAVLSEELQTIIEDEITEDWFTRQIKNMLLNPIGQLFNYPSMGANISSLFSTPTSVDIELDGYVATVNFTP